MNALIVDDEKPARDELRYLLRQHPDIRIVAEADSLYHARKALKEHQIGLVFLDIHMCGEDGFEVLPSLPPGARVIIVSADDSQALRAIRSNVVDYILKPVERQALAEALLRLNPASRPAAAPAVPPKSDSAPTRPR